MFKVVNANNNYFVLKNFMNFTFWNLNLQRTNCTNLYFPLEKIVQRMILKNKIFKALRTESNKYVLKAVLAEWQQNGWK